MSSKGTSIFISVYNTAPFVRPCIESVLSQDPDLLHEVVIVDDASTDGSIDIVEEYAKHDKVRLIQHEINQGAIASWNDGFQATQGEYVVRIDSDDRLRSDFLSRTVPLLDKHPKVGLVYTDVALIDNTGRVTATSGNVARPNIRSPANELLELLASNYIPAPTCIARRDAWNLSLPMPGWLGFCDWYQTVQVARRWDFYFLDEVLADYRVHGGNMHTAKILDRGAEETTFKILDLVFDAEGSKIDIAARKHILATNAKNYGDGYFGHEMISDARRCYGRAMLNGSRDVGVIRRWLATFFPPSLYRRVKQWFR